MSPTAQIIRIAVLHAQYARSGPDVTLITPLHADRYASFGSMLLVTRNREPARNDCANVFEILLFSVKHEQERKESMGSGHSPNFFNFLLTSQCFNALLCF